ncbi:hypothetical protein JCM8202_003935 [Rhodotorula sphaerocarpa]
MATTPCPFSSPLGAIHHASPEAQGSSFRAVLGLFRPKSNKRKDARDGPAAPTAGDRFPVRSTISGADAAALECALERSTSFTVEYHAASGLPSIAETEHETRLAQAGAPPTYEAAIGSAEAGVEEDIAVGEGDELFVKVNDTYLPVRVETAAERKARLKQERLEAKRQRLIEEDRHLADALDKLGF